MEFMLGLALGVWFWPVIVIAFLLLLAEDRWGWGTLILGIAAAWWFFATKELPSLGQLALYGCEYVAVGLVFTFVKWWFYVRKSGRAFNEAWAGNSSPNGQGRSRMEFASSFSQTDQHHLIVTKVDANGRWITAYNKARMTGRLTLWIVYWPLYMILILIEDFLKELIDWFLTAFGNIYRRMADSAYNAG